MTAEAIIRGRRSDGSVRRYGLEAKRRLLHVLATKTGELAYCGFRPNTIITPPVARARALESGLDASARGLRWCKVCRKAVTPQPNPIIWERNRPKGR
jgi:hypothetical protein